MKKRSYRQSKLISTSFRVLFCILVSSCLQAQPVRSTLKTIIVDAGHGLPDPGARGRYSTEADIALSVAKKLVQKLRDSLPECKVLMTREDENLPARLSNPNEANRWRAKFANENHGDLFICIHCNDGPPVHHSEISGYHTRVYYTGKGKHRKRHTKRTPTYRYWTTPSLANGTETYVWAVGKNDLKQQFVQDNADSSELYGERADSTANLFGSTEEKILATLRTKKYFSRSLSLANLIEGAYIAQGRPSRGVKQRNEKGIWVLQATAMPSILTEIGFITNPKEEDYLNSQFGQDQISSAIFQGVIKYKTQLDAGRIYIGH